MSSPHTVVVFLCRQRPDRAQLAAELFNSGVDPARARAVSADAWPGQADGSPTILVTMGGGDDLQRAPFQHHHEWPLLDPRHQDGPVRERVARHVRELIDRQGWGRR